MSDHAEAEGRFSYLVQQVEKSIDALLLSDDPQTLKTAGAVLLAVGRVDDEELAALVIQITALALSLSPLGSDQRRELRRLAFTLYKSVTWRWHQRELERVLPL